VTGEWDDYRRGQVRVWLREVQRCASALPVLSRSIKSQSTSIDMLKSVRFDRIGGSTSQVNGDDAMFSHITRMQSELAHLSSVFADKSATVTQAELVFANLTCHPRAGDVMQLRWIDGMQWDSVADEVGYAECWVRSIESDAELECFDLMPRGYRDRIPDAES
jgi:hypothetical protein